MNIIPPLMTIILPMEAHLTNKIDPAKATAQRLRICESACANLDAPQVKSTNLGQVTRKAVVTKVTFESSLVQHLEQRPKWTNSTFAMVPICMALKTRFKSPIGVWSPGSPCKKNVMSAKCNVTYC